MFRKIDFRRSVLEDSSCEVHFGRQILRGRFWEVGIFLTKVLVKAESADAVLGRAEAVEGGEMLVYSLIDVGNKMFRCQIAVFASSIAESRTIAEDFCSEVNSATA